MPLHDNDNKRLTIIWDYRKDDLFSCIKILHYVHILKNPTLNPKMKSRKLAAYFALRVVHTSQPAFRHKNTAKLAPFPRQKYEY